MLAQMLQGQFEVHREWVHRTARGDALPGAARGPVRWHRPLPAVAEPPRRPGARARPWPSTTSSTTCAAPSAGPTGRSPKTLKLARRHHPPASSSSSSSCAARTRAHRVTTGSSAGTSTAPACSEIDGITYANTRRLGRVVLGADRERAAGSCKLLRWPLRRPERAAERCIAGGGRRMRIALATDAWRPQINGVVTTLEGHGGELAALGHEVRVISPAGAAEPRLPELS